MTILTTKKSENVIDGVMVRDEKIRRKLSDQDKTEEMAKFKRMSGVGSDMLNKQAEEDLSPTIDINKKYSNCQAQSSDQLFNSGNGNDNQKGPTEAWGVDTYQLEDKLRNAKDRIVNKAGNIYAKLQDKWGSLK